MDSMSCNYAAFNDQSMDYSPPNHQEPIQFPLEFGSMDMDYDTCTETDAPPTFRKRANKNHNKNY